MTIKKSFQDCLKLFIILTLSISLLQCSSKSDSSEDQQGEEETQQSASQVDETTCTVSLNTAGTEVENPVSDADFDGDCVYDDGDESGVEGDNPCSGGTRTSCDDNCPAIFNILQEDSDSDGVGDYCDNCVDVANSDQDDNDIDGVGDACDTASDHDSIPDDDDNCPYTTNEDQTDTDGDGVGDACDDAPINSDCDVDTDGDGLCDDEDNCPSNQNATLNADGTYTWVTDYQWDTDKDGIGNACDTDDDDDGVLDSFDTCPLSISVVDCVIPDDDQDGDGLVDTQDNCVADYNPGQEDADDDGMGAACDTNGEDFKDTDGDGIADDEDNCDNLYDTTNVCTDSDGDGIADSIDNCDDHYDTSNDCTDSDGDGFYDDEDYCPHVSSSTNVDTDFDGRGDACDHESDTASCQDNKDNDGDGDTDCNDDDCKKQDFCDYDGDNINNSEDTDIDGDGLPNSQDLCTYHQDTWYLVPAFWMYEDANGLADDDPTYDDFEEMQNFFSFWNGTTCVFNWIDLTDDSDWLTCDSTDVKACFKLAANYDDSYTYKGNTFTMEEIVEDGYYGIPFVHGTFQFDEDEDGIGDECEHTVRLHPDVQMNVIVPDGSSLPRNRTR